MPTRQQQTVLYVTQIYLTCFLIGKENYWTDINMVHAMSLFDIESIMCLGDLF